MIQIIGKQSDVSSKILDQGALKFLTALDSKFNERRLELLEERQRLQRSLDLGEMLAPPRETSNIRGDNSWRIADLPPAMLDRRVEITGPVERKMMINALNSGASCFMADFEDANCPNWDNQIMGQLNVYEAYRRTINFKADTKSYSLNEKIATLIIRPRGWHLPEKHLLINDRSISGALFDFGLSFYHNARFLHEKGECIYYYLPKLESYLEARLWNDVFTFSQDYLGLPQKMIKATVLIETINAALQMEEILYELRDHSAGLNAGRWDYIFSCIKKFSKTRGFCLADRGLITMTVPFMRAYSLLLIKICHKRGAPAIGGMSALIPIKNDPMANEKAIKGVSDDKVRDANDGYDGCWVAHPGLVETAMKAFNEVLKGKTNQLDRQRDDLSIEPKDLLNFGPSTPVTEKGVKLNIDVALQYLGSWISGNGCVPIYNLMEDAATAEISRAQLWQWLKSKAVLDSGKEFNEQLFQEFYSTVIDELKSKINWNQNYDKAAEILKDLVLSKDFVEFLTLPAYREI